MSQPKIENSLAKTSFLIIADFEKSEKVKNSQFPESNALQKLPYGPYELPKQLATLLEFKF